MTITSLQSTETDNYALYNADCVELAKQLPDNSVDFSVYSPPFANLYIYSDSVADMGNCANNEEFIEQYRYLIREKLRITRDGRLTAIHCKDLPAYYGRDGYAGLVDFPGMIIRAHEEEGWDFHSRITIWKCPVTERERTNNNGLLHKSILSDQCQNRQGMADYLIIMRKRPDEGLKSSVPVTTGGLQEYHGLEDTDPRVEGSYHPSKYSRNKVASNDSINIWRRYAEPVWWDIDQQNVLNHKIATTNKDEKHICPLQLDVIKRAIQMWSNAGEVVFSPFTGVGSEGYCALEMGRKFIGSELKAEYYELALEHLEHALLNANQEDLFDA